MIDNNQLRLEYVKQEQSNEKMKKSKLFLAELFSTLF
jgi:hypothetical protein